MAHFLSHKTHTAVGTTMMRKKTRTSKKRRTRRKLRPSQMTRRRNRKERRRMRRILKKIQRGVGLVIQIQVAPIKPGNAVSGPRAVSGGMCLGARMGDGMWAIR